jgi:hypothetical protein
MKSKLSVFAALTAIILGLEFLFEVPVIAMGSDPFTPSLLIALLLSFGAAFFWFQFRRAA